MRSILLAALFVGASWCFVSQSYADEPTLKYFGFYKNVDISPDERLSRATAGYSNLAWIAGSPTVPPQTYVDKIVQVNCRGMRAVVDVSDVFFNTYQRDRRDSNGNLVLNPDGGVAQETAWKLRDDWSASWTAFSAAVEPVLSNVVALYIFDEPYGPGINEIYAPTGLSNLRTAIAAIKARFSSVPVAILYSDHQAPSAAAAAALPAIHDVDWLGIDCYTLPDVRCGNNPYATTIGYLKSAMSPAQRLLLVPQVALPANATCGSQCEAQLVGVMNYMYTFAQNDPQVIGMIPFLFWDIPFSEVPWQGFETLSGTMPAFKSTVMSVGTAIKNGMPPTTCQRNARRIVPVLEHLLK